MASPRTRPSGRSSGRAPASSGSNSQMAVTIGAIAILVVVILVVMMNGDDKGEADAKQGTPSVAATAPAPTAPTPAVAVAGSGKAGKTPGRPAPTLTAEMLGQLDEFMAKAKAAYNEGSTLRTAGNNEGSRSKQAEAKAFLDQWKQLVAAQLLWQEEAQLDDWAQPPEYLALEKRFEPFAKLEKSVRMGGGK